MSSAFGYTWQLSWDAGRILFNEKGKSTLLKESFQAARGICATSDFAETMFYIAKLHLDKIIEQKLPSADEELTNMGNDIAKILSCMQ